MTSRISSFNIAKEDMRHRTWMLALSVLGSVLSLPVLFLLVNHGILDRIERYYTDSQRIILTVTSSYTSFIEAYAVVAQGMILMFGAMIVAFFGYRYLYSRKMVDLYHSIPVKRSKLFFINYLNGFLIWLVPMLLSMLLTLVLIYTNLAHFGATASFGAICHSAGLVTLRFILGFLIMYHFTLVCVMLSGNIFNAICSTVIGGTLIFALYALLACGYSEIFFYTYSYNHDEPLYSYSILSPIVDTILVLEGSGKPFFWVGSIASAIVCLVAAWLLYLRRPSELAEHGIDNIYVQHFLRVVTSLLCGLAGAAVFIGILDKEATAWHLFGAILVGAFCFGVLNCIFHMNFRSFLSHKLEMLGTVLLTCLILLAFKGDWLGYDEYVPDKEDIASASLRIYDYSDKNGAWWYDEEDDVEMSYTDVDAIYNLLSTMTSPSHMGEIDETYNYFDIEVTLKNGRTFARSYRALNEDIEVLRPIIESEEYKQVAYQFSSGVSDYPSSLSIYSTFQGGLDSITDPEKIQKIVDAYRADFAAHSTLEELGKGLSLGELNIRQTVDESSYLTYSPVIWSNYTNTIAAIKELYPTLSLTSDDAEFNYISIEENFDSRVPSDILYSYYGIEGYEDYDTYYDRIWEEIEASEKAGTEEFLAPNGHITVYETSSEHILYQVELNTPEEIDQYKDCFYYGDYHTANFFYDDREYIYAGEATTSNGSQVSCYVKYGEMPLELIEQMINSEE